jgi:DNA-binding NarL/FixJ family response regulator
MDSPPLRAKPKNEVMKDSNSPDVTPVFIVEDHKMVRHMISQLIQRSPDFILCGEAASAEAALAQIPDCQPQLVLVDVSLPGMNGIELIRILHDQYPDIWTLALSAHDESFYAGQALSAGARGYVMKEKSETLLEALRQVRNGDIYISDKVQALLDGSQI